MNSLGLFLRRRASELGLSQVELAKRAGKSRATLYSLGQIGGRLPELETLIDIALALDVHPLRLIHLVFDDYPLPVRQERSHAERGDKSVFRADVTIPDGSVVLTGSRFTKIWEVQNVGTVTWEDRVLRCMDDEISVFSRSGEVLNITPPLRPDVQSIAVPQTPPGGIARLSINFTAPELPCSCVSYWKSFFLDGTACMPDAAGLWVRVRVISMGATADR